jgi:two-component system, NarL family, nitrate/nitrite response regulator NarL
MAPSPVINGTPKINGHQLVGEPLASCNVGLRVLIADGDGLARRMMHSALRGDERIAVVVSAEDAREALALARYYRPAVAVVDAGVPPEGALALVGQLLRQAPETRVLSVSVDDEQTAVEGLRLGTVGHISKDIDPNQLADLVVRAAQGEAIVPQQLLMPLLECLRNVPYSGWRPLHSRLTTREWEIIDLLADGANTERIAEQLVLSQSTVYSHVKNVLRKLGVHTRRDAVAAAAALRRQEASQAATTQPALARGMA